MDGQRFDHLTMHLTRMLTRRRFGRLLAGFGLGGTALAGVATTPGPAHAACSQCSAASCCDEGNGNFHCCSQSLGLRCCGAFCYDPQTSFCAGNVVCPNSYTFCAGSNKCCPPGSQCCGGRTCCFALDNEYCPYEDVAKCCRNDEGACRDIFDSVVCLRNPPCDDGFVLDPERCDCQRCAQGLIWCGGHCILPCAANQVLDFNTCACSCIGAECGPICCPLGKVCSYDGSDGGEPNCCPAGEGCGAACKHDPGVLCCPDSRGSFACVSGVHSCCPEGAKGGPSCCLTGSETCDGGQCVKPGQKKRRKKKKRKR